MICPRCRFEFSDEFNFCPRCGLNIRNKNKKQQMPPNIQNMLNNILEQTKNIMSGDKKNINFSNFKMPPGVKSGSMVIKITPDKDGKPKVEIKDTKPKPKDKTKSKIKRPDITKYKEPKAKIDETDSGKAVMLELPGVEHEKDIDIQKLGESIEIRAYSNKIGYFKNVPTSTTSRITSKEFQGEKLFLKIEY